MKAMGCYASTLYHETFSFTPLPHTNGYITEPWRFNGEGTPNILNQLARLCGEIRASSLRALNTTYIRWAILRVPHLTLTIASTLPFYNLSSSQKKNYIFRTFPHMPPLEASTVMDFSRNSDGFGTAPGSTGHGSNANDNDGTNNNTFGNSMAGINNMNAMSEQALFLRLQRASGFSMDSSAFGGSNMYGAPAAQSGSMGAPGVEGAGVDDDFFSLMYARRYLGQLQQQQSGSGDGSGGAGGSGDELLRLRQAGNATAATAAMFSGSDTSDMAAAQRQFQQRQQQQFQHFQQAAGVGYGFGGAGGTFPQSMNMAMNMNLPSGAGQAFMMQPDHMPGIFGGRGLDDYLLRTQQHKAQEAIRAGSSEQPRIELSPSRFLALQQQQNQQGLSGYGAMGMMDSFGVTGAMGLRANNEVKFGVDFEKLDGGRQGKRRYNKKKPSDMPRRPLSAYNLFFSDERERILQEIEAKEKGEETPQTEEVEDKAVDYANKKPKALLRPLLPSEKKRRPHRKTHGKISFRELAQMVGRRWKALPDEKRAHYQELAKEDMTRQKKAMEEYYMKQSEKGMNDDEEDIGAEGQAEKKASVASEIKTEMS